MSTAVTVTQLHDAPAVVAAWTLANGESGDAITWQDFADRSVQFTGTFGSGGTVLFEGSNDGTNYVVLTDPQGNAITKTAASIEMVTELTRYVRPRVSAGDGTTAIVITVFGRRQQG